MKSIKYKHRKILSFILIFTILLSIFPVNVFADEHNHEITSESEKTVDSLITFSYDADGNLISDDNSQEQSNQCNCGSDIHNEDCPLYEEPSDDIYSIEDDTELVCLCPDGVHIEGCYLYEEPIIDECTCGQEIHDASCALYEEAIIDDKVCTCDSDSDVHATDCALYNGCGCGSEMHNEDCPFYEKIIVPEDPVCDCEGEHSEDCEFYEESQITFEILMEIETLDELYNALYNRYEIIENFEDDEIEALLTRVGELYDLIIEPTEEETEKYYYLCNIINSYIIVICDECGEEDGAHLEDCSLWVCDECGQKEHTEDCSKYVKIDVICDECNEKNGIHLDTCSKYIKLCEECGNPLNSHKEDCSLWVCDECLSHEHLDTCSKYIVICSECSGENNVHAEECSLYICEECGENKHLESCSKYIKPELSPMEKCEECQGENGVHLETCTQYICDECGENKHTEDCSKYVDNRPLIEKLLDSDLINIYEILTDMETQEEVYLLEEEEIASLIEYVVFISDDEDLEIEILEILYTLPNAPEKAKTLEDGLIYFDLSYGNIIFTDTSYIGYDGEGNELSGEHNAANIYYIEQSGSGSTSNTISIGSKSTPVYENFEIHLCGVNIDAPHVVGNHAAAVYVNTDAGEVFIVLEDGSDNILKAYGKIFSNGKGSTWLTESQRFGHAAIEKEVDTEGTLVITCEEGLDAYRADNTDGHDCYYGDSCGTLSAYSIGEGLFKNSNTRTSAAAAIGSAAEISDVSDKRTKLSGAPTMGTLYNLVIAGGNITAVGAKGNTNSSTYLGGSPGIGVGAGFQQYSIGYALDSLTITGGNIDSVSGDGSAAKIGGGYHAGYVTINIYGGRINATRNNTPSTDLIRGPGIGGGGGGATSNATAGATVNIYGGHITASSVFGAGIGSGGGGTDGIAQAATVNIYDGEIYASTTKGSGNGAGAAIGTGGSTGTGKGGKATVNIYGGYIVASSELGADIGGGGTNSASTTGVGGEGIINISGGEIVAMTGGIGGGNANAGKGGNATLTITGGIINASSVSGGNSKTNNGGNAIVEIEDGIINTGFIGGGDTSSETAYIGSAQVDIHGGEIYGQIIMDSTDLASGSECYFKMDGGTIDMTAPNNGYTFTAAQDNGSVVYIVGGAGSTEAIAQISGGTIKNGSAYDGGAIYIAGGGSMLMSGGTISNFDAINNGGAIYIDGGNFTMTGGLIEDCSAIDGGAIYVVGGNIDMYNGVIDDNFAANNGGAIYATSNTTDILVNIFDGEIINNKAENHAGAIGASVSGDLTVTINIGKEECLGVNPHIHDDEDCPVIANNEADIYGGAFCLHGNHNRLFVNIYCGYIDDNIALRYPGSNTINQEGGKFTIYGGQIDPGVMVGGGIFEDNRTESTTIKVRFWGNYDGAPTEPVIIEATLGITLNFPANTYVNGSHELSGWTNVPNGQAGWVPVGGQYAVYQDEDEYLDYYAVWDAVVSYIVYIPESCDIGDNGIGEVYLSAITSYFKKDSNLQVFINDDFTLVNVENSSDILYYEVRTTEPGVNGVLKNNDLVASWQYNNLIDKILTLMVVDSFTSGNYNGTITFNVVYSE